MYVSVDMLFLPQNTNKPQQDSETSTANSADSVPTSLTRPNSDAWTYVRPSSSGSRTPSRTRPACLGRSRGDSYGSVGGSGVWYSRRRGRWDLLRRWRLRVLVDWIGGGVYVVWTYSATSVSASTTLSSLIHIVHGGTHPPFRSSSRISNWVRSSGTMCAIARPPSSL